MGEYLWGGRTGGEARRYGRRIGFVVWEGRDGRYAFRELPLTRSAVVSPPDAGTTDRERPGERKYPLLVRVLAVGYVLSFGVQIVGFLVLAGIGAVLFVMRRQV